MREKIKVPFDWGSIEIKVDSIVEEDGSRLELLIESDGKSEHQFISINNKAAEQLAYALLYMTSKYRK